MLCINLRHQTYPLESIIETRELCKSFKTFKAVDKLSFSIDHGDVYGFLGQNGAGKSTTMRMLLGLIFPDSGEILIGGETFNNSKRHLLKKIGAIIERPDMYTFLTGWENLKIFAKLSDKNIPDSRLIEVLELVGLRGREKDKFKAYSQGMKQRLGIAIALVHKPDLLILDEPTNGLDPQGIAEMRHLIQSLSKDHGKTILISSHLLNEIEQVATRMIIINRGKMVAEGKVKDLLNPDETLIEVLTDPSTTMPADLANTQWGKSIVATEKDMVTFKMNPSLTPDLNKWLVNHGAAVREIRSKHSLEAYFLSLTNDTATAH
jgi:ABC-type multidrug transport system ATPase subunit